MVQNYMETLVNNVLSAELAENPEKYADICQCPACLADVKCVALNSLPPYYITTLAGEVYGEYESKDLQKLSDVLVAVAKGIEAVRAAGAHSPGRPG